MIKLTKDFKQERGRKLVEAIMQDIRDRAHRIQKVKQGRALYFDERRSKTASEPWEGASNIHLPLVLEKIEGTVPKLMNAFWGTEPIVHVRRVADEFLPEETNQVEQFLNWGLESDVPNLYCTMENWFRNTLIDGNATVKPRWLRKWRKTVDVIPVKIMYDVGDVDLAGEPIEEPRNKTRLELLIEIFGMPDNLTRALLDTDVGVSDEELVGLDTVVRFIENRRELSARVVVQPSEYVDEVNVYIYRRTLERDSPVVDLVEFEDLIVPYRARDLQSASRVTQQYWLTVNEIERKVREGEWKMTKAELNELRNVRKTRQEEVQENRVLKHQKDQVVGDGHSDTRDVEIDTPYGYKTYDQNKLLFFEVYCEDDVDKDGESVKVVYHISYDLKRIVHADYLDEVSPTGLVPFITLTYLPVSDRWYGLGMAEILADINIEVNTILNHTNNAQELINNPFFFYVPAATTLNPQILEGLRPGAGVPVQDAQGVFFPRFMQEPLANLSAVDFMLMFSDRMSVSSLSTGNQPVRHAPRTARGTLALMSEGNVRIDALVTRFQHTGFVELCHHILGLYQRYTPDEKWYYVTGQETPRRVRPDQIRGRMEFSFTGNTVNTNREIKRMLAQVRYNTIMTHPDMATDPNARREALRDFLRHWSEGVDISRLLPAMPGQGGYAHPPMTQQSENQAIAIGVPVEVLPTDPHAEHLEVMERFERTSAFDAMPPEAVAIFAMHKRGHMQLLQAQMAQQQQPAGPGMGNNVPTGMTQAGGTDADALEGGVQ